VVVTFPNKVVTSGKSLFGLELPLKQTCYLLHNVQKVGSNGKAKEPFTKAKDQFN
jgi:hypothetical protein